MSVSQLNIFTFIKDIYQSLKHIDSNFNSVNEKIIARLTKLEENQQIIIDKLSNLDIQIQKLSETGKSVAELDKNLESELLKKVTMMNTISLDNNKIDLKPEELTFANIIENGYTFVDINDSLISGSPIAIGNDRNDGMPFDNAFDLNNGSNNNYSNIDSNINNYSNIDSNINNYSNIDNDQNEKNKKESLDSLLF